MKTRNIAKFFIQVIALVWFGAGSAHGQNPRRPFDVTPAPSVIAELPPGRDVHQVRKWLFEHGVSIGAVHTTEILSNLSGGFRRGTITEGKFEAVLGIDFERLLGAEGLTGYANTFLLHGARGPTREFVGNLNTISNIEALPTARLSEAWLQQSFWNGQLTIRAGQLVVDTEFLFSQYFSFFTTSDWPTNPAVNIPSGGPAYPLSTPGLRVRLDPTAQTSWLLAVFNGDPAGPGENDPEQRNRYGLNFRVKDAPFVIGEAQYRYNQSATSHLAGGLRFGVWQHFGEFGDLRFDVNGRSIADPWSTGLGRRLNGNFGFYGVIDQQLYRLNRDDPNSGILFFARAAYSPPDRSLNDVYFDAGIIFAGLMDRRPEDAFGASLLYSHISKNARALDADLDRLHGSRSLRTYELSFEFSYSMPLAKGWTIQPVFHHIINPGGGRATLPNSELVKAANASIVGMRSIMKF